MGFLWLSGFPALLAADFLLQFVMFVVSFSIKTDRFYDLTGTSTFVIVTCLSYLEGPRSHPRQTLASLMIAIWGLRLGSFLVFRILWYGRDPRFDKVLPNAPKFLLYWMIQGVWVIATSLPAHLVNFQTHEQPALGSIDCIGFFLWAFGFLFESVADYHKLYFRFQNQGKKVFVKTGLWRYSRHPNYFGEIVLWWGLFIVTLPALRGWQYLAVLCPVFVTFLLTRVSGIPLMERQYKTKYGDDPEYLRYKAETPILIPNFFK